MRVGCTARCRVLIALCGAAAAASRAAGLQRGCLLAITVLTGLGVGPGRRPAGPAAHGRPRAPPAGTRCWTPEPGTVDYARSFFPVALVVLLLRSFVFEPFRIPSDSMMPTLLDGDFIIVTSTPTGLRLPVINRKILEVGEPRRGDVVVFRWPVDPSTNFIKRLVGLPGDHVEVRDNRISINGKPVDFTIEKDRYNRRLLYEPGARHGTSRQP